jgi:hypothetical protein
MRSRLCGPGVVAAVLAALLGGCRQVQGPTTTDEARALLQSALEAHGGRAALAQFDNLRIVSNGRFKGALPFRRTVDYRGPDTWSMTIEFSGGAGMRFGVAGDRCWRSERHLTALCSDGERRENARIAALHNAHLLRINEAEVRPAGTVDVDGRVCPAIRAGDVVLAFDPVSHRLAQVRLEDRIDTLSDYRSVGGAQVAAHRVLTIGGQLDVDETWTEIVPGGADPQALRVPELPRDGLTVDETDAERPVAWMDVEDAAHDLPAAIARLDAFIRARGRSVSDSDGVILSAPDEATHGRSWRVAVGVEGGEPLAAAVEDGLHLETWPAVRIVGVFHLGDPLPTDAVRATLRSVMRERGLVASNGARWQILFPREDLDRPPAERLSLVRIAVH